MGILYQMLVRRKLEYNSVVRNNLSFNKSSSVEIVQLKFLGM